MSSEAVHMLEDFLSLADPFGDPREGPPRPLNQFRDRPPPGDANRDREFCLYLKVCACRQPRRSLQVLLPKGLGRAPDGSRTHGSSLEGVTDTSCTGVSLVLERAPDGSRTHGSSLEGSGITVIRRALVRLQSTRTSESGQGVAREPGSAGPRAMGRSREPSPRRKAPLGTSPRFPRGPACPAGELCHAGQKAIVAAGRDSSRRVDHGNAR